VISNTGSIVIATALIGFGALFMLAEPPGMIVRQFHRLAPRFGPAIEGSLRDMETSFRWWPLGTLFSMVVVGVVQGLGYWAVGLRFALPLGAFAGLAEIVPTFGPLAAFLVALMVAGTQSMTQVIGVTVVYVVVQLLESNLLIPLVMQRAVNIPPLVTLFTIILWGQLFGILGLILTIPINLAVWTLIDRFYIRTIEQNVRSTPAAEPTQGGQEQRGDRDEGERESGEDRPAA
jgi:predicted PurR-regulated permease PerM